MKLSHTKVLFQTNDLQFQQVVSLAEVKLQGNLRNFGEYRVLVKGGGYNKIFLET